jgi:hypothetical protein
MFLDRPRMTVAQRSGRYRPSEAHGRWLVVWLAVLAAVAQTALFDFAMAAQATDAAQKRVERVRHAHHGMPQDGQGAPTHEHGGKDCPFCVARATHQAPSLPSGIAIPAPLLVGTFVRPGSRHRLRARRRPARFHSRSPPHPSRLSVAA